MREMSRKERGISDQMKKNNYNCRIIIKLWQFKETAVFYIQTMFIQVKQGTKYQEVGS